MKDLRDSFVEWLAAETASANLVEKSYLKTISDQAYLIANFQKPKKPLFGINVHLSDPSYSNIDKMIADLKYLGITNIRNDFDVNGSGDNIGKMLQHDTWLKIKPKLDAAGIKVRPMVYKRGDGFATMSAFAELYPEFDEIEIVNEGAVIAKGPTMADGTKATEYDTTKLTDLVKYIFSAYTALLTSGRPIKPITSLTWVHYYFIDSLRSAGININISVHSYSDGFWSAANRPVTNGLNAYASAKARYGDMVFEIGEANYMPKDLATYTDALQLEKGGKLFDETYGAGIDTWWYELYDRPHRAGRESMFGLIRADGSVKPLGDYIKSRL